MKNVHTFFSLIIWFIIFLSVKEFIYVTEHPWVSQKSVTSLILFFSLVGYSLMVIRNINSNFYQFYYKGARYA